MAPAGTGVADGSRPAAGSETPGPLSLANAPPEFDKVDDGYVVN